MTMTAPELMKITGVSLSSIKGVHRRKNHVGFSQKEDLPQDVVDHFINREGVHETDGAQTASAEPEPKKKRTTRKPKASNRTESNQSIEPTEQTEPKEPNQTEQPTTNQPEPTKQSEPFNLGDLIFFHPTAQFVFVTIILSGGAYIFATLAGKLYPDQFSALTFVMFFLIGFLADSSGIILAKKYKRKDKWDEGAGVWFLLGLLFLVQIFIESSYMFFESDFSWPGLAVVCVRPLAQLIYSGIYLNE